MKRFFRNRYLMVLDILSIFIATVITYFAIFNDLSFSVKSVFTTTVVFEVCFLFVFLLTGIYRVAWNFGGSKEIKFFIYSATAAVLLMFASNEVLTRVGILEQPYRRFNFIIAVFSILEMIAVRTLYKEAYRSLSLNSLGSIEAGSDKTRVLIIGAGDAGALMVHNVSTEGMKYEIVGFIDDDRSKQNKKIYGYKVLGGRDDIINVCRENNVDKIILAIPSAYVEDRKSIINICQKTKCDVKTIPTIPEIFESGKDTNFIRNIKIEDLLERDPVKLDNREISDLVKDKIVLISGGGGSIGSELCRQIMRFSPKKLIIIDIYENNAYDIQMELIDKYTDNKPLVLIASICDNRMLEEIFSKYKPDIVFHAAAHKHVPLMEYNPGEAIKNNVFGTYTLACVADKFNVKKFVMISTDKAVNPTNIMGATKRLCEMIIQCMQNISTTEFVAVRFGNVLGSNGSVIPLFKHQIENGGPVKVTHKDVTRFFMTIPEAAQLVIQAACYAKGGEIFVLDMGKPVKIYDLAENMIKLSGYTPNVDMKIEIIGLRPGEKLYEELLMEQEGLMSTNNKKIFIGHPLSITPEQLQNKLAILAEAVACGDDNKIRDAIEKVVPTYIRDNESFNRNEEEKMSHV